MKAPVHRLRRVAEPVLGVLAVILLWELASRHAANATLVPPPAVVWRAFVAMQGTDLPLDIGASLLHLLIGYGLGATAGLLLALIANQRAVAILAKGGTDEIIKAGAVNWAGTREAQTDWIDNVLWRRRGWSWVTEGDARTLVGLSTTKAIFQTALEAEAAKKIFALGADVSRAAYEATGRAPERGVFDDMKSDVRGKPIWEAASWNLKA